MLPPGGKCSPDKNNAIGSPATSDTRLAITAPCPLRLWSDDERCEGGPFELVIERRRRSDTADDEFEFDDDDDDDDEPAEPGEVLSICPKLPQGRPFFAELTVNSA